MKIYCKTYGCTLNQSDTEAMMGLLVLAGHEMVDEENKADLVIYNTCTVKDSPEKSFYSSLKKTRASGKKVIVAGCVSQADPKNDELKDISIVGVRHLENIVETVESTLKGTVVKLIDFKKNNRLNLPKIRKNSVIEIIPISSGCLGDCTFCKTRFARGKLYSYPVAEIKKQMIAAISEGVKEIWLTSQDAGAYGKDINSSLGDLLDQLVSVKGEYKIRLGMINPDHAKNMVPELVRFLKHEKSFKFIHLPIQSASDAVLNRMNRRYTSKEFKNLVTQLRREVNNLTVATDIITGFPGETELEHKETLDLVEEIKFDVINLTKFYPRTGTIAAQMKLHPTKLVKKRSLELAKKQRETIDNSRWINWSGTAIVDEIGKEGSVVARNESYVPIVLKTNILKLGDLVDVIVIGANQYYLDGVLKLKKTP